MLRRWNMRTFVYSFRALWPGLDLRRGRPVGRSPGHSRSNRRHSRLANGRPDFSGTYDVSTLTPLTRPAEFGDRLALSREEAEEIARKKAEIYAADLAPSDPDREAPPVGGTPIFDPAVERASGGSGGYNGFFMDKGDNALKLDGKWRTSILVDPPNGQMPAFTEQAQRADGCQRRLPSASRIPAPPGGSTRKRPLRQHGAASTRRALSARFLPALRPPFRRSTTTSSGSFRPRTM